MAKYIVTVKIIEIFEVEASSEEEACRLEIEGKAGKPCIYVDERDAELA